MLSTNVLCIKKRKKRSYCIANNKTDNVAGPTDKQKRSAGGAVTMLQITEDTPPDMLAGAMDLTVHLPTGRSVKMSVERSTPMMDLLVQISTNHHLQLSGHTIQALGMAPSNNHSDNVLACNPNTPIGALDTQHIKVIPKPRTIPVPKNIPPGHQPFESTFRLKVHLPKNQLYVTRVSQSVQLGDIMKKVCEEKDMDSIKYELRHPGNLDQVLDPKLSLSYYGITEIYLVPKGTRGLNQTFSTTEIMDLRKEEERKQMHSKIGGGVFNLIFRRGKSSTGSLSSENRSISPTHSDDSRSVTPPGVQQQIIMPSQSDPPVDKPKPPQRKRRPAPKPPQKKPPETKKVDTGLTICHSRNSSDSSGYHEASILSDNCNTSLPRRPKSTIINEEPQKALSGIHSQSTSNLSKMSSHSKSTSSLAFPSRKKKTAPPPPPPVLKPPSSRTNVEEPSPVVASQPPIVAQAESRGNGQESVVANNTNPLPTPRPRTKTTPAPRPRSVTSLSDESTVSTKTTPAPRPHSVTSLNDESTEKETNLDQSVAPNKVIDPHVQEIVSKPIEKEIPEITEENEDEEAVIKRDVIDRQMQEIVSKPMETEIPEVTDENEDEEAVMKKESIDRHLHEIGSKSIEEETFEIPEENEEEELVIKKEAFDSRVQELVSQPVEEETLEVPEQNEEEELDMKKETFDSPVQEIISKPIEGEISEVLEESEEEELLLKKKGDAESSDEPTVLKSDKSENEVEAKEIYTKSTEEREDEITVNDELNVKNETPSLQSETEETMRKSTEHEIPNESTDQENSSTEIKNEEFNKSEEQERPLDEKKAKPPEIVALFPKAPKKDHACKSMFDSYTRKRGFQIGTSLLELEQPNGEKNSSGLSTPNSVTSALNAFDFVDEIDGLDVEMFTQSLSKKSRNKSVILNQLHGMHELGTLKKNPSAGSLRSVSSLPGFLGSSMKKWNNIEGLDDISLHSCGGQTGWVIGDTSDTESIASITQTPLESLTSLQSFPLSSIDSKPKETEETIIPPVEAKNVEETEPHKEAELESEWQYQLPSPPKAFRDSSPVPFAGNSRESIVDSVVTSPELFEKLKVVKDQSEKETVSDMTSVVSDEEKPILNKLSLENLEKRKSLVYNRELATSLKMPQEERKSDAFSSSLTKFEKTYEEVKRSSPSKEVPKKSTLPNFKITTYDNPKQKLNIFEDDTISSNADRGSKRLDSSPLQKSHIGRSMENISFRKNSSGSDDEFNKKRDYKFYRQTPKPQMNVCRSESFSKEPAWAPSKPVTRSKSQVALNKYNKNMALTDDELTKSNSLFDVSGLQSLGVMRLIQNKLNTPNNSTEQLDKESSYQEQPEVKSEVQNHVEEKQVKTYQYRVPSINMGTWSDRPKIPVNVKDDPDYKYSVKDANHSKLIVNTVNNDIKSHNSVEVRNKMAPTYNNGVNFRVAPDNRNVSIKVNGSEPITGQNTGNVVIKIGGVQSTAKPVFRKPLGNVNENNRPHSIAFGSDFDISRVPIVRSVELKKPYKDFPSNNNNNNSNNNNNTSVTQIYNNNFKSNTLNRNSYNSTNDSSKYCSSETLPIKPPVEPKPVFRVNSYLQNSSAPVVRGFRNSNETNRMSWNQPHSFSTLPAKTATKDYSTNKTVPFSQSNLRRTESTKIDTNAKKTPPAPAMPKLFNTGGVKARDNCGDNPKEQLLQAIRDFGGKKGLRAVKA